MANNSRKFFRSRLVRIEEKKSLRKAFFFSLLTIVLLLGLIFVGIPLLTKMAVFLSEIRGSGQSTEQNDTIAPQPPRFNSLPEDTKEQTLSVSGFAEPSSTVEIFLNDSPIATTTTTAEGTFNFEKINLNQGKNEIYGLVSDKAGNKSQASPKTIVVFDNTPPKLEIAEPQNGAALSGERKRKIKISGQSEEDVSLMVNDRLVIVDQEGKFSTDFSLSEGENLIEITATDRAGNQSEQEVKVSFSL